MGSHFDRAGIQELAALDGLAWAGAAAALTRAGLLRALPQGQYQIVSLDNVDVVLAGARGGLRGGPAVSAAAAARLAAVLTVLQRENGRELPLRWELQRHERELATWRAPAAAPPHDGPARTARIAAAEQAIARLHAAEAALRRDDEADWRLLEDPRVQGLV